MKKIIFLVLLSFFSFANITAQETNDKFLLKPKVIVENSSCELKLMELTLLAQYTKPESLMIIISQTGKEENAAIGKRRLNNAKALFTKTESKYIRSSESIIVAEGEKLEGEGKLDFYVIGELKLRITFKKNKDLFIRPCALNFPTEKFCSTEFEKLFYPCKKK